MQPKPHRFWQLKCLLCCICEREYKPKQYQKVCLFGLPPVTGRLLSLVGQARNHAAQGGSGEARNHAAGSGAGRQYQTQCDMLLENTAWGARCVVPLSEMTILCHAAHSVTGSVTKCLMVHAIWVTRRFFPDRRSTFSYFLRHCFRQPMSKHGRGG
jgi:hypothetical protein